MNVASCTGDCNGDGSVTIDELIVGVRQGLEGVGGGICTAFDDNRDSVVSIDELVRAVNNALNGCS